MRRSSRVGDSLVHANFAAPGVARKNNARAADPKRIFARRPRVGVRARAIFHKLVAMRKRHFVTIMRRGATIVLMKAIIVRGEIAFAIQLAEPRAAAANASR